MRYLSFFLLLIAFQPVFAESKQIDESEKKSASDFYRKGEIDSPSLSPDGKLVVYEKYGNILVGSHEVPFVELYEAKNNMRVIRTRWVGNRMLMVEGRTRQRGFQSFLFIEIEVNENTGEIAAGRSEIFAHQGYIIDPLISDPYSIIFAFNRTKGEQFYRDVYHVKLFSEKKQNFQKRGRINYSTGKISTWALDAKLKLVAGVSSEDETPSIWRVKGNTGRMVRVWTGDKNTEVRISGVSSDGQKLFLLTDHQSDTIKAKVFDLEKLTFERELAAVEGKDIANLYYDSQSKQPIAVSYFAGGKRKFDFLDDNVSQPFSRFQKQYPAEKLTLLSYSVDYSKYLVHRSTETTSYKLAICTEELSGCETIGSFTPWLDDVTFSSSTAFRVKTVDGIEIESFITLPHDAKGKVPVIVKPHGGPIGIFDSSERSQDTQWLAYNGYAVIEVNYRGSGGYGNAFEEQGLRQWGRGIEDDIELATDEALKANSMLDPDRICIYGGSYGGYSAIMGIIRSPERYKCAASFAGVTDLPLRFSDSSIKKNDFVTEKLIQIMGSPVEHKKEMMAHSPVYNYEKINTPLLLMHGTKDRIVDVEHSWRLSKLLKLRGMPHELLIMDDTRHSFNDLDEIETMYNKLIPFLDAHLK